MNRRIAAGIDGGITRCHTARMPGVAYMISRAFAAASIPGGQDEFVHVMDLTSKRRGYSVKLTPYGW
jgi:hypothetical protein